MKRVLKFLKWLVISLVLLVVVPALVVVATLVGLAIRNNLPWMYSYNDAFNEALYQHRGRAVMLSEIWPEYEHVCLLRGGYDIFPGELSAELKEKVGIEFDFNANSSEGFSYGYYTGDSIYGYLFVSNGVNNADFIEFNMAQFAYLQDQPLWCADDLQITVPGRGVSEMKVEALRKIYLY